MAPPKEKVYSREYAESLDMHNDFRNFRSEFVIPTKADLRRKTLAKPCMFHRTMGRTVARYFVKQVFESVWQVLIIDYLSFVT